MSYTFDPTSPDTFVNLQARVVFNSFSETRYAEFTKRALNDAVTAICRQLKEFQVWEVVPFDSTGAVTFTSNIFHLDAAYFADSTAGTESGQEAFARRSTYQLTRLQDTDEYGGRSGSGPYWYRLTRKASSTGFAPELAMTVVPARSSGGYVAVHGRFRPAVMNTDDDTTGLGAEFDKAVVAYAKAECFLNEDDFEARDRWMVEYTNALRAAIEGDITSDGPEVLDGTWGPYDC